MCTRSRNFIFVLNNYEEEEYRKLTEIDCVYMIIGKEIDNNGIPYLQGYIEFNNLKTLHGLKSINSRIYWEPRCVTQEQAINYCKKKGNYIEFGERKRQGRKKDINEDMDTDTDTCYKKGRKKIVNFNLKRAYKILEDKGSMKEVIKIKPSIHVIKAAEKWVTWMDKERNEKPEVIWIFGESESGKTILAKQMSQGKKTYWKNKSKWWNGYDKEEVCIIDDLRSRDMIFTQLLRLLDRYPYKVEFKGGSREFNSKIIIITSIKDPSRVYKNIECETYQQIKRRIDRIILCKKDQEPKELTEKEIKDIEIKFFS
ncbi:Rep-like protein [Canarypox virus]|uniref:ATP-dependent helicase Rep n=1 Tax=Canarypox virus TaxID=44088 RepID=Q6VZJ4_CNPV|nr:Rep-like protein [Canarypox virus]AAR83499.1 CNPV153 Rep-like protein [Canarypox virus]AWD84629.1 Rep-like protein [Canarypox virus]